MNAIKKLGKYLRKHPDGESGRVLRQLVGALDQGDSFPLEDLYLLDQDAFELAIHVLKQWRFRRHMHMPLQEQIDACLPN